MLGRTTDKGLETLIVRNQCLRKGMKRSQRLRRLGKPNLDAAGFNENTVGKAGHASWTRVRKHRDPNGRRTSLAKVADKPVSPLKLSSKHAPLKKSVEAADQIRTSQREYVPGLLSSEDPHQLTRSTAADTEELLDVPPSQEFAVEGLELTNGVRDRKKPGWRRRHQKGPLKTV